MTILREVVAIAGDLARNKRMLDLSALRLFHCYSPNRDGGYVKRSRVRSDHVRRRVNASRHGCASRSSRSAVLRDGTVGCPTYLRFHSVPGLGRSSVDITDSNQKGGAAVRTPVTMGSRRAAGSTSIMHANS